MLPVIQIGRVALPVRPLILLATLYAGLWLAGREATRRGFDGDQLWDAGFLGLAVGLVGGRLAYVFLHWNAYRSDPGAILSLTPGTIAPLPALMVGSLIALAYLGRKRLITIEIADAAALGLALSLALISLGNLLSGDAFGTPTNVPWAISLWGERRHPVQVYEMLAMTLTLAVLWWRREKARPGHLAWAFVLGYGLTRLAFEPFRAESWIWANGYHGIQLISLAVVLLALWRLTRPARSDAAGQAL